jgi:phospholipase/carboxylesterase
VAEEYVLGVVEDLRSRYEVSGVWLMGHSQGAGFTFQIGLRNPDVFSGLIPNAGWLDREWLPDSVLAAASGLPVFVIHGRDDGIVEYQAALDAVETLEGFGCDVELFDFEGGHRVPEEGLQAAREWMREVGGD